MRSDADGRWDPATVVGLKSTDRVLVIGNAAFMPWLSEVASDITSVRKPSELVQFVKEGEKFDKVILPRESTFSTDLVPLIEALLDNNGDHTGLFIAFPSDDGWSIEQATEFFYPDCQEWAIDSTFGHIFIAAPRGISWRLVHNG